MSENQPQSSDQPTPKKFRITRKRLGTIRFIDPKGEYGFIDAEDFRDDVFFHHTVWRPDEEALTGGPLAVRRKRDDSATGAPHRSGPPGAGPPGGRGRPQPPAKLVAEHLVHKHVEFEIDDEMFEQEQRLRATVVRPTRRPMGRKLSGRDATFNIVTHHPKARRKRPDWRG